MEKTIQEVLRTKSARMQANKHWLGYAIGKQESAIGTQASMLAHVPLKVKAESIWDKPPCFSEQDWDLLHKMQMDKHVDIKREWWWCKHDNCTKAHKALMVEKGLCNSPVEP